jgi:hypothetical protein
MSRDKIVNIEERKKRAVEIARKITESYPMVGGSTEDYSWRSLTSDSNRDINQLTQRRMQDIAFYLYDSNPMAHRIVEIVRDFVVGDGFTYTANDKDVLTVIDDFWNDPDNNMDFEVDTNVLEMSIFGENCIPVWVNPANGAVKLGYIDPVQIVKIKKDPHNPKINKTLIWQRNNAKDPEIKQIINIDRNLKSPTYGKLVGDCFFFAINKVTNATRGRSDLLCLADWLDGYDQFLFARLERAFLLNSFIWDITAEGMDKEALEEFVKGLSMPKSGSIRAHNEKIKWETVSPNLESSDASQEARLFKNQILGGAGYPEHWFAEGSTTTRATALEMGLPTLKKLKSRQKWTKFQLMRIIDFVIDQAIIHGELKEGVDRGYKITPSPIISRDNKVADTISNLVDGLKKALDYEWVDQRKARAIFGTVISQLGVDMEAKPSTEEDDNTPPPKNQQPVKVLAQNNNQKPEENNDDEQEPDNKKETPKKKENKNGKKK